MSENWQKKMSSRNHSEVWKLEEQYLLRVRDANLAERLRGALNASDEQITDLEIIFNGKSKRRVPVDH